MAKKKKAKAKSKQEIKNVDLSEQSQDMTQENEIEETEITDNQVNKDETEKSEDAKKDKEQIKAKDKKVKSNKKAKKTNPNSLGEKIKGTYNELKKVTWPSFGKVVKQTGVVLAFVIIFVVILLGFNSLFGWLFDLFTNATV